MDDSTRPISAAESGIPLAQVDAFTDRPFAGNPAAVCLLPAARPADWLQDVAREMNLSETAFLVPQTDGYALRWFTPATEVALCGHATLASAHYLWESGRASAEAPIRFETASGILTCTLTGAGGGADGAPIVWMDFPAQPPTELSADEAGPLAAALADALGADPVRVGRSRFDLLVELASEAAVRGLEPDRVALEAIEARGVIVTAAAGDPSAGYDFVSRFFAPRVGVPEDPVTGSAHCCLSPWWSARLGRERLTGYQASRRGGTVRTVLDGDRVRLGGRAVTVFTGTLRTAE